MAKHIVGQPSVNAYTPQNGRLLLDLEIAAYRLRGIVHGLRMIASQQLPKDPEDARQFKENGKLLYVLEQSIEVQSEAIEETVQELRSSFPIQADSAVRNRRRPTGKGGA